MCGAVKSDVATSLVMTRTRVLPESVATVRRGNVVERQQSETTTSRSTPFALDCAISLDFGTVRTLVSVCAGL
jgi:hypothetical protein